jgi:hypothetical protein
MRHLLAFRAVHAMTRLNARAAGEQVIR